MWPQSFGSRYKCKGCEELHEMNETACFCIGCVRAVREIVPAQSETGSSSQLDYSRALEQRPQKTLQL